MLYRSVLKTDSNNLKKYITRKWSLEFNEEHSEIKLFNIIIEIKIISSLIDNLIIQKMNYLLYLETNFYYVCVL